MIEGVRWSWRVFMSYLAFGAGLWGVIRYIDYITKGDELGGIGLYVIPGMVFALVTLPGGVFVVDTMSAMVGWYLISAVVYSKVWPIILSSDVSVSRRLLALSVVCSGSLTFVLMAIRSHVRA